MVFLTFSVKWLASVNLSVSKPACMRLIQSPNIQHSNFKLRDVSVLVDSESCIHFKDASYIRFGWKFLCRVDVGKPGLVVTLLGVATLEATVEFY